MNRIKNLLIFLYFTLMILFPNLGGTGPQTIVSLVVIFAYAYLLRDKIKIPKIIILIALPLIYVVFTLFMNSFIFNNEINRYYIVFFLQTSIMSLGIYCVISYSSIKSIQFYKILLQVLFVNIVFTWVQYFNILDLREFALSLNRNFNIDRYVTYRAMGLMSGFDLNGIILSLSCILYIIYSEIYCLTSKKKYIYLLLGILAGFSTFLAARTGVIVLIVILLFYYFNKILKGNINSAIKLAITIVAFISVFNLLSIFIVSTNQSQFDSTFDFILEAVENYRNYGVFFTESSQETLNNHYFLPDNLNMLFFGNTLPNQLQDRYSDVGYIQLINGIGLIGLILVITVHFLILFDIYSKSFYWINRLSKSDSFVIKNLARFLYLYLLILFIACLKGPYFFSEGIFYVFIIIYTLFLREIKLKSRGYSKK